MFGEKSAPTEFLRITTRVLYESGEVDLHNVHLVRCPFSFTADERGARLATAIALDQASIVIQLARITSNNSSFLSSRESGRPA